MLNTKYLSLFNKFKYWIFLTVMRHCSIKGIPILDQLPILWGKVYCSPYRHLFNFKEGLYRYGLSYHDIGVYPFPEEAPLVEMYDTESGGREYRPFPKRLDHKKNISILDLYTLIKPNKMLFDKNTIKNSVKTVKFRRELLRRHSEDSMLMLAKLDCVINRKKYHKNKNFFIQFNDISDLDLNELLDKYLFDFQIADYLIANISADAYSVIKKYTCKVRKLFKKNPNIYIMYKSHKKGENDCIVFAQSPFGFYWQVLGYFKNGLIETEVL